MNLLQKKKEIERILIECMYCYHEVIVQCMDSNLSEKEFSASAYKKFLKLCLENYEKGKSDLTMVWFKLEPDERSYILDNKAEDFEITLGSTPMFFSKYIKELRKINSALELSGITEKFKGDYENFYNEIDTVKQSHSALILETGNIDKRKESSSKDIIKRLSTTKEVVGITTGFKTLDYYTKGFCKGNMWVVGGYTSYGKSMLAVQMALHALRQEAVVDYFSMEMTQEDLLKRMIACETSTPTNELSQETITSTANLFSAYKLNIYDTVRRYDDIVSTLRGSIAKGEKPDVVFIDYLQNIISDDDQYNALRKISHSLQAFAVEEDVCIVALSQVGREYMKGESKSMGFKGSGDIEESSDVAIELERHKNEAKELTNELTLHVKKNRKGQTGSISCKMKPEFSQVIEVTKNHDAF